MRKRFKITIKKKGKEYLLTPVFEGRDIDHKFLIRFFGLDKDDVEWYKIEEEKDTTFHP